MCGLAGVAGTILNPELEVFNNLIHVTQLRGPDSTGVANVSRAVEPKVSVFKDIYPVIDLIGCREWKEVVSLGNQVLIGHTRSATVGTVKPRNAHPFDCENVVGAHNGTIQSHEISRLGKTYSQFDVDSHGLYQAISDKGVTEVLPDIQGAWALTFWDKTKKKLCWVRNDRRPLSYTLSEDGLTLWWASEAVDLLWSLAKKGVKFREIKTLETDVLYEWTIPAFNQPFEEPERTPLGGRPQPAYENWGYGTGGHYAGQGTGSGSRFGRTGYTSQRTVEKTETEVVSINKETGEIKGNVTPFVPGKSKQTSDSRETLLGKTPDDVLSLNNSVITQTPALALAIIQINKEQCLVRLAKKSIMTSTGFMSHKFKVEDGRLRPIKGERFYSKDEFNKTFAGFVCMSGRPLNWLGYYLVFDNGFALDIETLTDTDDIDEYMAFNRIRSN